MSDAIARGGNSDFHADAENPPDDLRTRIATTLRRGILDDVLAAVDGVHDIYVGDDTIRLLPLADAVIRELGLFQQWLVDGSVSDGEPRAWELPCETRYVTEWKRFDA